MGLVPSAETRAPKTCLQVRRNILQKRRKREHRKNESAEMIALNLDLLLLKNVKKINGTLQTVFFT